jgi:hypothetical protein
MSPRRSPRRAAALAAARRGWPVFPLYPFSKYPGLEEDWEGQATTDPDQIDAWWYEMPFANIGIACGPAKLVVVDLDAAHGDAPPPEWVGAAHGRDVLRMLAQQAGQPDPVETYTVVTPRDGEHRYFVAPPDVELRGTIGTLGWRIDTRAAGGYIIAAGSAARIDAQLRFYCESRRCRPAVLPEWLVEALTPPPRVERPPVRIALRDGRRDAYVQAALDGEVDNVQHAASGTRARTLFRSAFALGGLVGAGVLDRELARRALTDAVQVHIGVDDFTQREADGHIKNGLERGERQPRQFDDPTR